MNKLDLLKFYLCCYEAGEIDIKLYAKTVVLISEDDEFALKALEALKERLANYTDRKA